ncbi:MAG: multifunctional oxoglutarate decarboxylase/oxoglutarate dehydrogenase thiamine pyrophosphate-binding subunit/dihydrolipoyllysine-residue succinyltransferase subunit [Melioribacteraceae bacterium]|nr:multifunctional oxoglutarate decarboxylase/oxoglutarate dehydrogenase thiamine pyrophosphate-binding subunit/dihydrolipoyllysine-residue succinyltransferase subunit [Melioribacteraceae bacterium]MCF8265229.1 multifunctional oxoglutarate decarboxylase/oxoglutarate dehydrogenase thiamine pyrophosphate-binding subunit/dihydrolipoyllysine-residue succinyltransferase subunit [Melioribacteraceae bacterium]MCF8413044.1 multifunctional oxoglutarate decarboxylase/oxoglutarate dehydrogenase thiamine pyr
MKKVEDFHKELFEHFGYNFGFVSDLLEKYLEDRESVSEYWKSYFDKITKFGNGTASEESKPVAKQSSTSVAKQNLSPSFEISSDDEAELITGIGAKIIENMDSSLTIPTATSLRTVSVKLLEENRRIINHHLKRINGGKISYSHVVAYAIVKAIRKFSSLNNSFALVDDKPHLVKKPFINLGIAVDMIRKNGTRSLIVPNIKKASQMNFAQFKAAYDDLITRTRTGKIEPSDFQGTTISLTNPGGIGTVSSTPRLMTGQGCIIAVGAIDYPAEFKAMSQSALAGLGIGKVMNMTSTYDHRIIQGAESGEFLKEIDSLLRGDDNFYEQIYDDLEIPQSPVSWGVDTTSSSYGSAAHMEEISKQAQIPLLINIYRVRGHLNANLNPLAFKPDYYTELDPASYGFTIWDYDREFITGNLQGLEKATLREILDALHHTYCEKVGAEFMHIQNPEEKYWLMSRMEPIRNSPKYDDQTKKRVLEKLIIAESFEHFLHTKFIGHKRFSLEGSETVIPVLDYILSLSAEDGVEEVFLGMAHRGRLNVLSNIIGKSYDQIFSEFEDDIDPDSPQGTGDVKYHLGATGTYKTMTNKEIQVSVASNPSHLEFVNPVVEGIVRAKQTRKNDLDRNKIIPLLIHGDAAFAGQGIVAETLNLSQLKGYRTGGTIHLIINNQIGFTTAPEDARSSPYATDVAKMVQAPIFHVNGDDPEASIWVTKLAFDYRQRFNKDVVIDLFGYRRHGHNEGDDPVYTQPLMYKKIKAHPSVKNIYAKKLVDDHTFSEKEIKSMEEEVYKTLEKSLKSSKNKKQMFKPDRPLAISMETLKNAKVVYETRVTKERLVEVVKGITNFPENFTLNPKLKKHINKRKELLTGNARIDWAFGEALAFGTLLLEGSPVRLSGQDSARGTFSQRHLIFTDINTGEEVLPHNHIRENQETLEALDSLLSENAVLGFEFGFSAADPLALVLWEAQFGDFANGAQVIIDNFIASAEVKWNLPNNLVMLLPHGQEGQGPEHSSARLERFLILCGENNMVVANPTTPAQYFHLLRRQILTRIEKPLIVLTPKSLLRLPAARSEIKDFTDGTFRNIIDDNIEDKDKNKIERILFTSGKVYYELEKFRDMNEIKDTAIIRLEQYYPYDPIGIRNIFDTYPKAKKIVWVQEEPQNMGAWYYLFPKLINDLPKGKKLDYCGRDENPSPANGSSKLFMKTQENLVRSAFK